MIVNYIKILIIQIKQKNFDYKFYSRVVKSITL